MSATKRGKQKQQAEVSEEEDFQKFVRESLGQLSKGQKQIIQDISNLKAKVKLNETALDKISTQFKTLNDSFEELKGELHDARCKVDEMESSVQKHAKQIEVMRERLLSLDRSFRINLRKFCPTVIGCYYWNDIPLSIREKTTKKLFKRALFNYYLAQY